MRNKETLGPLGFEQKLKSLHRATRAVHWVVLGVSSFLEFLHHLSPSPSVVTGETVDSRAWAAASAPQSRLIGVSQAAIGVGGVCESVSVSDLQGQNDGSVQVLYSIVSCNVRPTTLWADHGGVYFPGNSVESPVHDAWNWGYQQFCWVPNLERKDSFETAGIHMVLMCCVFILKTRDLLNRHL